MTSPFLSLKQSKFQTPFALRFADRGLWTRGKCRIFLCHSSREELFKAQIRQKHRWYWKPQDSEGRGCRKRMVEDQDWTLRPRSLYKCLGGRGGNRKGDRGATSEPVRRKSKRVQYISQVKRVSQIEGSDDLTYNQSCERSSRWGPKVDC